MAGAPAAYGSRVRPVLSLVNQALAKEWGISATQRGLLGSSIFVGFFLGSISSALYRRAKGPAADGGI